MPHYLDHAATTDLRSEARAEWLRASESAGNASSIHGDGQRARRTLEDARERIAATLDCEPIEVLFTSGGTESVNLALKGLWWSRRVEHEAIALPDGEHHATLDAVEWLRVHEGATVRAVPLEESGRIGEEAFVEALPGAAFATALTANNEVGTVNDARALAAHARDAATPLHLDAVATFGHLPLSFRQWRAGADGHAGLVALSVSAHKIGGPSGIGALVVARAGRLTPLLHGGGQQRGLRAGTQDVPGAAAFAVAAECAIAELADETRRLTALRDRLIAQALAGADDVEVLGDREDRMPGNAHFLVHGAIGETLLFLLDQAGVSVSTGSACQAGVPEPSHVVMALGRTEREAREVVRVTLGRTTTEADVAAFAAAWPSAVARARAASGPRSGPRS